LWDKLQQLVSRQGEADSPVVVPAGLVVHPQKPRACLTDLDAGQYVGQVEGVLAEQVVGRSARRPTDASVCPRSPWHGSVDGSPLLHVMGEYLERGG
jgi:hypothetical protein